MNYWNGLVHCGSQKPRSAVAARSLCPKLNPRGKVFVNRLCRDISHVLPWFTSLIEAAGMQFAHALLNNAAVGRGGNHAHALIIPYNVCFVNYMKGSNSVSR